MQELIRDGNHSVADLMSLGATMLGRRHVLPSVLATLHEIQVEGTFPSGTYLVTVHNPISSDDGDLARALYGSFLPIPNADLFSLPRTEDFEPARQPGAVVTLKTHVECNRGRRRVRLRVTSRGDRPIQVGSHYHFTETNPQLDFDRSKAYGYRLDIAAGTSVRFEPGDTKTVTLVEIAGNRIIQGGNGIAKGVVSASRKDEIVAKLQQAGFAHTPQPDADSSLSAEGFKMSRAAYAAMFGPTTGDVVRLGMTDLWIKVEKDFTVYGDECKFGGGKTLREGMGQATGRPDSRTLDLVVTNALIVDWTGIYKADIGVKDGLIVGIGKAGNPDVMEGVTPGMVVGSCTDVIAGEGKIITAGGIDSHIHFICPQQADEAIASGITTMLGGGTGPRSVFLSIFGPAQGPFFWRLTYTDLGSQCWHICDDMHSRRKLHAPDASGMRQHPGQHRYHRQGQRQRSESPARASYCRRVRAQAPRRLGQHARGHRRLPQRVRRDGRAVPNPHGHAQRVRIR